MNTDTLTHIAAALKERNQTVTCAESCTGGLLAAAFTQLPGSSAFFERGFVTYSNQAKQQMLNVSANALNHYGAVSEAVVQEMALGALLEAKSDYALSISGIAGPEGGSPEKPVGTVWFGFATKQRIVAEMRLFSGSRSDIRTQAVAHALHILADFLRQND